MQKANDNIGFLEDSETEEKLYREIPHNIEAEQVILGAILSNNKAMDRVGDFLRSEHFHLKAHQKIYEAIEKFSDRGLIATPITLKNFFDNDEMFEAIGGAKYLIKIASMSSTIIDIRTHASIVYSLSVSRELIEIGEDMVNNAFSSTGELRASEQIEISEQKLFALASEGNSDSNFAPIKYAIIDSMKTAKKAAQSSDAVSGIPMGYTDIDNMIGGIHNSDLIILAARPSMGKTAFALNITTNAAEYLLEKHKQQTNSNNSGEGDSSPAIETLGSVGFISLEMSAEQLATRMISSISGINAGNIRRGKLDNSRHNDEFKKLIEASNKLHELPIFIDDTPALSISAVRTRARRLKRKHNLSLLIVDYLQLMRSSSEMAKSSRVQEISDITMGLKAIAKELNIPVIALSQLSRAVEQRPDKRPQLSDLRESGSIEQDADQVMFIYREAYYVEREKPSETSDKMSEWQEKMEKVDRIAEIMFAKNRHGPVNNITLFFDKNTTRFGNFEHYHDE